MKISIQDKLKEKNMTRYELAKRIGVTYPTIDNIYKGTSTSIKFEILEAICRELDCTPNDIMVPEDPRLKRLHAYYTGIKKMQKKGDTEWVSPFFCIFLCINYIIILTIYNILTIAIIKAISAYLFLSIKHLFFKIIRTIPKKFKQFCRNKYYNNQSPI